jgi:hypothetical protein
MQPSAAVSNHRPTTNPRNTDIMNALEICHHFAAENYGPRGTRRAGNISAEQHSRTLYSYAAPIARHTGNAAIPMLITSRTYSATTSKHTSYARRALHHLRPFEVNNPAAASASAHADNVRHIYRDAQLALATAANARRRPETRAAALNSASALHAHAETYRAAFRLPLASLDTETRATRDTCRRIDPDQLDAAAALITQASNAAITRRAAAEKKRTAAQRAAIAEQEERDRTRREEWLAGAGTHYPREHYSAPARLRVIENAVETSHGARVHVRAAARLWPIAERAHRTGTTYRPEPPHKVGPYALDEVSPAGVRIGCHVIPFEEMQRVKDAVMAAAAIHTDETAAH